jgi:hypothetical protein
MAMTYDYWSRYAGDGAIPQANLDKPAPVNWLKENAREDDAPGPHVHVHVGDTCDADLDDHEERLNNVEQAVLRLIREYAEAEEGEGEKGETGDGGAGGAGGPSESTSGSQSGYKPARGGKPEQPSDPGDFQQGEPQHVSFTKNSLPSTPDEINRANQAYWNTSGHNMTGGSQSLAPNSKAASSGGYLPNQAGSVNQERVLSTTNKSLSVGRTFGVTADALRQAKFYRQQRLATNKAVSSIQAKLDAAYKRG